MDDSYSKTLSFTGPRDAQIAAAVRPHIPIARGQGIEIDVEEHSMGRSGLLRRETVQTIVNITGPEAQVNGVAKKLSDSVAKWNRDNGLQGYGSR